jgi:DNA mismatch repair ATPase MutS
MAPGNFYAERLIILQEEQKKLQQKKTVFGIVRFGNIAVIIAAFYFLRSVDPAYMWTAAVILLAVFIRLIYKDLANRAAIAHNAHLIRVNEDELKAVNGSYYHFENGNAYTPKDHYYANDLDIFGHASLYQFLNRTTTGMGGSQLAAWLLDPATPEQVMLRQEAVKELAAKPVWRQQLQAYGKEKEVSLYTQQRLNKWLNEPALFIRFGAWQWLRYVLPAISVGITAAAVFGFIPINVLYGSLLLFGIMAFQVNKVIAPLHERLSKMVDELETLSESIRVVEKEKFTAGLLTGLQAHFLQADGAASRKIRQLKKILDKLDMRYNMVISAPLNLLLLWNLQQVLDLEKWKVQYREHVNNWFGSLGIFEALNSFGNLYFNHPGWTFPVLQSTHFSIEAGNLGHPLINESKRVNNFIKIDHKAEIMLVTGSNMAGKSTYLRSVGINVVLAMAGAPVCADRFLLSPVQLLSSMRIADNLEESTSTFYAELKKLKTVIDKVNAGEKVFVLLDEILRGTNSLDRHTGSVALVKQLIRQQAAAIIATHDIALADLQKVYPRNILNFHFDVQVNNEELYFDYQLKPGVCTSMNASILMKKIGIEL